MKLVPTPPERTPLVAFGAHPDDIEFGCGGIIVRETRAGRPVHLVICSRGEAGTNGTPAQRTKEAEAAAKHLGATVIGTTKSYADNDNAVVLPGYTVVNAFANVEIARDLTLQLGVNNLFDSIGYTEAEGQGNLSNNPLYVARSINGRSAKATLRYSF